MREVRKWEDLKFDCLVNILRRVGIVSLLLDVPFVCKSWHEASFDHSCWQHLDFTLFTQSQPIFTMSTSQPIPKFVNKYRVNNFSIGGLIRLLVARGSGKSTTLVIPSCCCTEDLNHISETCHELSSLSLKMNFHVDKYVVPKLICKWKHLEELNISVVDEPTLIEIVSEIQQNCYKFCDFTVCQATIGKKVGVAIANHIPKITKLSIHHCYMNQKNLEIIIKGCKDLEVLDVYKCVFKGFWDDKKLRDLGSNIKMVNLNVIAFLDMFAYYDDFDSSDDDG